VAPPDKTTFGADVSFQAISPDGRKLVFVAADTEVQQMLWLRPIDGLSAQPLRGTDARPLPSGRRIAGTSRS